MKGSRIYGSRIASPIVLLLVLAALTSAALARQDAPPPPEPPDSHILVVPATPQGEAALERSSARVIATYEDYTLVEATGPDEQRLRGSGADRRDDMLRVRTAAGSIDPARDRRSLAGKGVGDRHEVLALVQFEAPPKDPWLARLRATGAQVVSYMAQNGYVVHARGDEVERLAGLVGRDPAVRAVTELGPADKVEGPLSGETVVAVQTLAGPAGARTRARAAGSGASVRTAFTLGALSTQFLRLSGAEVAALASDPAVVTVESWSAPEPQDERGAQIVAGNMPPAGPGYKAWLDARGFSSSFPFTIDVTDTGLDRGLVSPVHPDFAGRVGYVYDQSDDAGGSNHGRDCTGHGTNVASIATGRNEGAANSGNSDAAGFRYGEGVAPRAFVGSSKIFNCSNAFGGAVNFVTLADAAAQGGAVISNNSWGGGSARSPTLPAENDLGDYSVDSRTFDFLVRDARPGVAGHQPMVEVFAAGNNGDRKTGAGNEGAGSITWPGTAKNVITVGASESVRAIGATDGCGVPDSGANNASDVIDFSGRGPTDDGRLKPDLVAPGTHVTGASPQDAATYTGLGVCFGNKAFPSGNPFYSLDSGTSQAAPHVSGAAALVRDWFDRTTPGTATPSPALTKALLVNTATDLAGGDGGKGAALAAVPNMDQGWGRVNVGTLVDSTIRQLRDQMSADVLAAPGDARMQTYSVQDPTKPVKVTLAWTDAPGPTTGNAFVNDLDLVVDARGRSFKGNVFAGGLSVTGGAADTRNNLESVFLPAGTSGRFAVRVGATTLGGDGLPGNSDATDQDFALVVSNALTQSSAVLTEDSRLVADPSPGGDGDGTLESGEQFDLTETVRNRGDATASGVSATVTGSQGLSFTQSSSAYPAIAPNATGANSSAYEGAVSSGVVCGTELPATLEFSTSGGSHTVPLVLPTGHTGAETVRSPAATSLSIPDDSAAGVVSQLTIADRGRIKDLNIEVQQLNHPWVGDLAIDVVGPDGTTVRLAEHPGGPDNSGDNLIATVFDDEAATNISSGSAPYTGSFRPQNDQLSRFDGKSQQGTWTLRVRDLAEDQTGTLVDWASGLRKARCDADVQTPDTQIDSGPSGAVASSSASFSFSSPDEPDSSFECRLDPLLGAAWLPCTSPKAYTVADGPHTFEVRARDGSDNVDEAPEVRTWTVDTTPPQTSIVSGPSGSVSSTNASFTFASEPGAGFECSRDGAAFSPCTSPQVYAGLAQGAHTFRVRASDALGNTDATPATSAWTVDTIAPAPAVTDPVGGAQTVDRTPLISGTAGTAPGDGSVVTVEIYAEGGASPLATLTTSRNGAGAWSAEAPFLTTGNYSVRARQSDLAGNAGTSTPVAFTVVADATPPAIDLYAPQGGTIIATTYPRFTGIAGTGVGDEGSVIVDIFAGPFAAGLPVQTLVVPVDPVSGVWVAQAGPLPEGTYTVRVRQVDSAGNVGSSVPRTFVVDLAAALPGPTPAPSFVLAPAEERLSDALAGRYTVLAACASACRVEARLTVSPAAARRLGLRVPSPAPSAVTLGRRVVRLSHAGTARAAIPMSAGARSALRSRSSVTTTLRVSVREGASTLRLRRGVVLRRSFGLARVARTKLPLWAVCSRSCALSGRLTISRTRARRLGLPAPGSGRVAVASGRTTAGATPVKLRLALTRAARARLAGASGLTTLLEAVAGSRPDPQRRATRKLTLRR